MDPQTHRTSTSAIDLTGTPTGLAASLPPSPSLIPLDSQKTFARRRTSWGRVDAPQDPLHLELLSVDLGPSTQERNIPTTDWYSPSEDPFYSPIDELPTNSRYQTKHDATYTTAQAGPSTASLIEPPDSDADSHREDDEAHLTNNMSVMGTVEEWSQHDDPERIAGASPYATRRRTAPYPPSPLQKTSNAFKSVSQNLRRVSFRVVNLASAGLEHQVRLGEGPSEHTPYLGGKEKGDVDEDVLPDLNQILPIRGRTLGFLGPTSKLRLALFRCLVHS
jgi:hypothetical protein